jgi:tetrathionate reductase subunit A
VYETLSLTARPSPATHAATGVHGNAAMRVDPHLSNVKLQDLAGGSAVFFDTKVKVIKDS